MDSRFSVAGQTVIVTGASRGIGRSVADGFLEAGAKVVYVARSPEMAAHVAGLDQNAALSITCDVSGAGAPQQICQEALSKFGRIDTLINNAGVTLPDHDPYSDEVWDQTLNTNLRAAYRLSRSAAGAMGESGGGSIINIGSIAALMGFRGNPAYPAAKAGLRQLAKALAADWAPLGVRVNTIHPGYIRTDMTARSYNVDEKRQARTDRTMLGRWGETDDLVGPCIFLASPAAAYITGADLVVDGGFTANGI